MDYNHKIGGHHALKFGIIYSNGDHIGFNYNHTSFNQLHSTGNIGLLYDLNPAYIYIYAFCQLDDVSILNRDQIAIIMQSSLSYIEYKWASQV